MFLRSFAVAPLSAQGKFLVQPVRPTIASVNQQANIVDGHLPVEIILLEEADRIGKVFCGDTAMTQRDVRYPMLGMVILDDAGGVGTGQRPEPLVYVAEERAARDTDV